jgi:predicted amidophosphoribosyltransferase
MVMTYQPNAARLQRLYESEVCLHCRKEKEEGNPFCKECFDKLPSDLQYEITETEDTITRNLACADAQVFLEGDFK